MLSSTTPAGGEDGLRRATSAAKLRAPWHPYAALSRCRCGDCYGTLRQCMGRWCGPPSCFRVGLLGTKRRDALPAKNIVQERVKRLQGCTLEEHGSLQLRRGSKQPLLLSGVDSGDLDTGSGERVYLQ